MCVSEYERNTYTLKCWGGTIAISLVPALWALWPVRPRKTPRGFSNLTVVIYASHSMVFMEREPHPQLITLGQL